MYLKELNNMCFIFFFYSTQAMPSLSSSLAVLIISSKASCQGQTAESEVGHQHLVPPPVFSDSLPLSHCTFWDRLLSRHPEHKSLSQALL